MPVLMPGPTTSGRMDAFTPALLAAGLGALLCLAALVAAYAESAPGQVCALYGSTGSSR